MPTYQVTDPQTGQSLRLTGDSPPTEQELEQIFAQQAPPTPAAQPAPIAPPIQQPVQQAMPQEPPQQAPTFGQTQRPSVIGQGIPPESLPPETRAVQELPELGRGGLLSSEDPIKVAKIAPVLLTTTNPQEMAQILTRNFPHIGIQEDEQGNLIAGNNKTGAQVVINKPGLSQLDIVQGLGIAAAFTPATRIATAAPTITGKLAAGGVAAAGTEAGIQAAQKQAGGEFDTEEIAIAGGLGVAGEAVLPVVQAVKAAKQPITEAAEETLTNALRQGTVLTSDVNPPTTFMSKGFQTITERVPFIGTGSVRARQQVSRQEALENIAREFDIDPSSGFEKSIVDSATRVFKGAQKKAARLRNEAVQELNKLGDINPTSVIKEIDSQIDKIKQLGGRGDSALLDVLQNIKGELAGNFERLKNIRTTIFDDISDVGSAKSVIRSGGDAVLTKVAGALSKDLDDFAVNAGKGATGELRKAAGKWKASNRIFKDNFAKSRETELKRVLTKGKMTPEVINTVIKGGKQSELNRLHANIDLKGRKAARQQIIKLALEKSGFPERLNPTIFLNELSRPNNKKAINTFFKGSDRKQLEGLKKFLNITRRAQEEAGRIATRQEATGLALLIGGIAAPKPVIGAAAATGVLGRAYESKPVRDLLIKLSNVSPASKRATEIMNQLKPLIITAGRE